MTPESSRPPATADAWQISNPPILAMGPVRTSLELFDAVGHAGAARAQRPAHRLPGRAARRGRPRPAAARGHPARPGAARLPALGAHRRGQRGRAGQAAAVRARRDRRRPRAGHRPVRAGAALLHVPRLLAGRRRAAPRRSGERRPDDRVDARRDRGRRRRARRLPAAPASWPGAATRWRSTSGGPTRAPARPSGAARSTWRSPSGASTRCAGSAWTSRCWPTRCRCAAG